MKWIEGRCENCGTEFSVPLRMVNANGHFIEVSVPSYGRRGGEGAGKSGFV